MFKNIQRNFRKWSLEMRGQPNPRSAVQGPRRLCVVFAHISETLCIVYVSLAHAHPCYNLQPGHHSSLAAPNFQSTANQERGDQCGNQHYSCKLLMMGIVVPETC